MEVTTGQGEAMPTKQESSPSTDLPKWEYPLPTDLPKGEFSPLTGLPMWEFPPPASLPIEEFPLPTGLPKEEFPPPTGLPKEEFPPPTGLPMGEFPPPIMPHAMVGSPLGVILEKPKPTLVDALLALALTVIGFLFWEWTMLALPFGAPAGVGATLFFLISTAASCVYLYFKGIRPTPKNLLALGVVVLGSLPFILYGARDINALLVLFEFVAALTWIALACQTTIKSYLSGFLALDAARQTFYVPFRDFFRIFVGFGFLLNGKRVSGSVRTLYYILVGLLVSIPVFALVIILLSNADDGFRQLTESLRQFFSCFDLDNLLRYCKHFVLGIPVACYLFGLLYGSYREARCFGVLGLTDTNTDTIASRAKQIKTNRAQRSDDTVAACHKIPRATLYTPLVCFVLVYLVFFVAMGSYLFSALQGEVPGSYTYAQYARQGFFELCGVAFINLTLLAFVYLFGHRAAGRYPRMLRVLTGILSACTCLLIATAMSKMYLYIQTYGLTPLRLYTSWFMIVLMVVFLILVIWHIRPFNAARPILVGATVLLLVLGLTNTNGLIANYNVDRYLSGQTNQIDVAALENLSDAAIPALYNLYNNAQNSIVRNQADEAIRQFNANLPNRGEDNQQTTSSPDTTRNWTAWNIQTHRAETLATE